MITPTSALSRGAVVALSALVALVLAWRALVVGLDALEWRTGAADPLATGASATSAGSPADPGWRERLARNPADAAAVQGLALQLEAEGKKDEAKAAMQQAVRLAPGDSATLTQAAGYFLRTGDEAQGLVALRRAVDVSREINSSIWDVFLAALDSGNHRAFFDGVAGDNPVWWPVFFRLACERSANAGAVQAMLATREKAAVAKPDERRCVIERLRRDGKWTDAYDLWLSGLPREQRESGGAIFNGGFEFPLSNLGFDWLVPAQEGIDVAIQSTEGMIGRGALAIGFVNKRYSASPIYQHLLLAPGRYQFEGRGRTDLETWLGLQWGLYCEDATGRESRQLAYSDRFVGSVDWRRFRQEFVIPKDCPVQLLRLELANPKRDSNAPGEVVVRLKGRVWFDDLRIRILD